MPSQVVNYATNIALIKNGIVENIIWGMIYSLSDYEQWGYTAIAIDGLAVEIGDTYNTQENKFYNKSGNLVKTADEIYDEEISELDSYIIDLEYQNALSELEEQ